MSGIDLAAVLTGAPAAKTIDPVDMAIRTIYGEAPPNATKEEHQAIAAVIANRAAKSGKSFAEVVQEPGQFEPWGDEKARARLEALTPEDPTYKAIQANVSGILAGKDNPYPGLTNFYAPKAQAALGRPKPEWDDGTGQQIGAHLFFGEKGAPKDLAVLLGAGSTAEGDAEAAYAATFGDPSKYADARLTSQMMGAGEAKEVLAPADQKVMDTLIRGGALDDTAPMGSVKNPHFLRAPEQAKDIAPGDYYVSGGKLQRAPGGDKRSSFTEGLQRGGLDVLQTFGQALPGEASDSALGAVLEANRLRYGADYGGDFKSGAGRFTGQLVASAPLVAGAEVLAAPALANMGAVGTFLAGQAGKSMAPGLARFGTRAGSAGARMAGEGALGAGLVSSANPDQSVSEQMLTGAVGGALLGPLAPVARGIGQRVGGAVRSLIEPLTFKGREQIVGRVIDQTAGSPVELNLDRLVPGVEPTLAEAAGNANLSGYERVMRTNPQLADRFAAREAANKEARAEFLANIRGDSNTVADLADARRPLVEAARSRAFQDAGTADTAPLVAALDGALEAPEAQMDEVARTLQSIRDKVIQPAADTTPQQTAAFNRAVAQTFGADANALTPEVMQEARARLGSRFEEIAANTEVPWDDGLRTAIGQIIQDTAQVVPESSLPPLFRQLDNIASTGDTGKISGASYQALTKKGAPLTTLQNSADPTIRDAANRIREALDDGLERSVGPEVLDDLRAVRLQYKNLKTAEAALRSAGPDKAVTPQAVLSAVKRNFGQFAYQGGGPLGDVAEAAVREQSARPAQVVSDPRQLYGMRQNLDAAIAKQEALGTDAGDAAAAHLTRVRDALDGSIETGAPAYRDFLAVSERSNEPVQATRYLQGLNLTDAKGAPTLSAVQRALEKIEKDRAKPGRNAAKLVSEATLEQLVALRDDLARASNIDLGRARGSDTRQNLATDAFAGQMGVPLALGVGSVGGPVAGAALSGAKLFYGVKNKQILDQLANRLLNPDAAAPPMAPVPKRGAPTIPLIPVAGGLLANRLTGQ